MCECVSMYWIFYLGMCVCVCVCSSGIVRIMVLTSSGDEAEEMFTVTIVSTSNGVAIDSALSSASITVRSVGMPLGVVNFQGDILRPLVVVEMATPSILSLPVERSGQLTLSVSVSYTVSRVGVADPVADDVSPVSGTVQFPPLQGRTFIDFTILSDTLSEQNETFMVTLTNPTGGATLNPQTATATFTILYVMMLLVVPACTLCVPELVHVTVRPVPACTLCVPELVHVTVRPVLACTLCVSELVHVTVHPVLACTLCVSELVHVTVCPVPACTLCVSVLVHVTVRPVLACTLCVSELVHVTVCPVPACTLCVSVLVHVTVRPVPACTLCVPELVHVTVHPVLACTCRLTDTCPCCWLDSCCCCCCCCCCCFHVPCHVLCCSENGQPLGLFSVENASVSISRMNSVTSRSLHYTVQRTEGDGITAAILLSHSYQEVSVIYGRVYMCNVCVCVCMRVCDVCMCVCDVCMCVMYACVCVCMYVCMHMCVCVYVTELCECSCSVGVVGDSVFIRLLPARHSAYITRGSPLTWVFHHHYYCLCNCDIPYQFGWSTVCCISRQRQCSCSSH